MIMSFSGDLENQAQEEVTGFTGGYISRDFSPNTTLKASHFAASPDFS